MQSECLLAEDHYFSQRAVKRAERIRNRESHNNEIEMAVQNSSFWHACTDETLALPEAVFVLLIKTD